MKSHRFQSNSRTALSIGQLVKMNLDERILGAQIVRRDHIVRRFWLLELS